MGARRSATKTPEIEVQLGEIVTLAVFCPVPEGGIRLSQFEQLKLDRTKKVRSQLRKGDFVVRWNFDVRKNPTGMLTEAFVFKKGKRKR